jgi:hypothetical protein
VESAGPGARQMEIMNLDVIQIVLGIVTFVTFVMAARTGLTPSETKQVRRIVTNDTQFIKR